MSRPLLSLRLGIGHILQVSFYAHLKGLSRECDRSQDILETQDSKRLFNLLDGIPLAIVHASAFMQQTMTSFLEYIALYEEQLRDWPGHERGPTMLFNIRSVCITSRISCSAIGRIDEAAVHLLHVWSYLSDSTLWFELLVPAYERLMKDQCIPEWFCTIAGSTIAFARTMKLLVDYSLVEGINGLSNFATRRPVHELVWLSQSNHEWKGNSWLAAIIIGMAVPQDIRFVPEDRIQSPRGFSFIRQWLLSHADSYIEHGMVGRDCTRHLLGNSKRSVLLADSFSLLGDLNLDQGRLGKAINMFQRSAQEY